MSYILEALRKSEQQREIGRVPGLTSVHENTAKSVSGNWRWLIVAVLLLNAGLLVLLLWPEPELDTEAEPATMPAPVREPVQARQSGPAVAPVVSQPLPRERSIPRTPQTVDITPPPAPPAPEPVKIESTPKPAVQEPVMAAAAPAQPQVVQPPRPAVEAEPPALPVWPQIPTHLFQQLSGNLRLDVHVFSDQPQERFVLINMKKYREGEKLQDGPQLDEITAEGVIMSFRGQQFRLQAQ